MTETCNNRDNVSECHLSCFICYRLWYLAIIWNFQGRCGFCKVVCDPVLHFIADKYLHICKLLLSVMCVLWSVLYFMALLLIEIHYWNTSEQVIESDRRLSAKTIGDMQWKNTVILWVKFLIMLLSHSKVTSGFLQYHKALA